MDFAEHIDYLVVGHICRDLTPDGPRIGGTAAYSAATALVLGCRTAVVTSAAEGDLWAEALPAATVHQVLAPQTTTFVNEYQDGRRKQLIHAVAAALGPDDVPLAWQRAAIVHLGPVAGEVDPALLRLFPNSLLGVTPQGWLRAWDENGRVRAKVWAAAAVYLPLATAVFLSDEDLVEPEMLGTYRQHSNVLVMTQGAGGCVVYAGDEARSVPAPKVHAVDTTGAGDIFATAFLVRLQQTAGNAWEAARFANDVAAQSVTAVGLAAKMDVISAHLARV